MRNFNSSFLNNKWPGYVLGLAILASCFACSEDEEPAVPVVPEKEAEEETFEGKYVGGWWSNATNGSVYVNIAASAIIKKTDDETKWVGEFFYSRNHTSCCSSNANDGTISFTLIDGVISEFQYDGTIPGCSGDFSGEGEVNDSGKITIVLTSGSDCEGDHSDARIELSK